MSTAKQRTFRVPAILASAFSTSEVTLDDLEIRRHLDSPAGVWSRRVLRNENNRTIEALLGRKGGMMPLGVVASAGFDELIVGLLDDELGMFTSDGWVDAPPEVVEMERAILVPEDVAFVARAFAEGADSVILKPSIPSAWLAAGSKDTGDKVAPAEMSGDWPTDAILIAIVDELDADAVLELIAVAPGPFLFRRHDGKWEPDDGLLTALKAVTPPPTIQLDPAQSVDVIKQVDESTAGLPFELSESKTVLGSAASTSDLLQIERALLSAAVAAKVKSEVDDAAGHMPNDLKRYWTVGRGAAKIRWGTPRAMTRCARYMTKYVGPSRAHATCNNLGKMLGGKGVAWDVK